MVPDELLYAYTCIYIYIYISLPFTSIRFCSTCPRNIRRGMGINETLFFVVVDTRCDERRHFWDPCPRRAASQIDLVQHGSKTTIITHHHSDSRVTNRPQAKRHNILITALNSSQVAFVNPRWRVTHMLKLSNSVDRIGKGRFFLSVGEALDACSPRKCADPESC